MALLLKVLHVVGAIMFVGNIVTAAFWKFRADRSGDIRLIAAAQRGVMAADLWFTAPGVILIIGCGLGLVRLYNLDILHTGWLLAANTLMILSGVIWVAILLPCQRLMIRYATQAEQAGVLDPAYHKATLTWNIAGSLATLLPFVNVWLMVAKPF